MVAHATPENRRNETKHGTNDSARGGERLGEGWGNKVQFEQNVLKITMVSATQSTTSCVDRNRYTYGPHKGLDWPYQGLQNEVDSDMVVIAGGNWS